MVIHLKLSSGGISATAGRSSRAGSNQAVTDNTEVKVEVKRELWIGEFEGGDHGEEEQDGGDEYDNGGVPEEDEEMRVLYAGRVSYVQAMKENHAQAVRDFVRAEQVN